MNSKRQRISQQLNRRIKILGLITVISVATVITIAYSALLFQQKDRFISLKNSSVLEVENYLSDVFSSLQSINDALMVSDDKANLLNIALSHREKIKEVYLIENKKITSSSSYMLRDINLSDKQLASWIDNNFSNDVYMSQPFFDYNTIPYIYVGTKTRNESNQVIQTLVARLDLSNLWVYLNRLDLNKQASTVIYNKSGRIILHSNLQTLNKIRYVDKLFENPEYNEVTDLALKRKKENQFFLLTGQRISGTNWYLAIEYPLTSVTSVFLISILVLALFFSLIIFLIYQINKFTRKKVIEPIFLLQRGVEELEAGNLNHRLNDFGNNELGYIALVLNKLSSRLSSTLTNLNHRVKELNANKQALEKSEASYRSVVNNVKEILFNTDNKGCWQFLNPAWEATTGFSVDECLGKDISNFIYDEDVNICLNTCHQILGCQLDVYEGEVRILKKTGEYLFMQIFASPSFDDEGNILGVTGTLNNITEQKLALKQLKLTSKVYVNAREAIVIADHDGFIIDANPAYKNITGYDITDALTKNIGIETNNLNAINFHKSILTEADNAGYWSGELKQKRKNGNEFVIQLTISTIKDNNKAQNYVALFSDVTEKFEYKKQLEYSANYDALTNLPNRTLLTKQLKETMASALNKDYQIAICYLDLDGFKEVNDIYGHNIGDGLLIEISENIQRTLRKKDVIARLGGDEFVAVLIDVDEKSCKPLLEQVLQTVSQPIQVNKNRKVQISASLGVTFYPQQGDFDADQLLRQADQAMYQAKIFGKNRYHFFDTDKDRDLRGINQLLEQIAIGLKQREFVLFYQPKVKMKTGETIGFEALIRWQHPERGLLSPFYFLDALKNQPLAIEVGNWVIRQAISQLATWNKQGFETSISINVDSYQLQQSDFIASLVGILNEFPEVYNSQIEFEILESNALEDISSVSQVVKDCRDMGIHFALDDFGTGFSSLSHLKNLPVRDLKIDRSFVRDMLEDLDDLSILDGTLGLAQAFRRGVVAEGVETVAQGDVLLKLGCEIAQGFVIAKPMPEADVMVWIKQWQPFESWQNQEPLQRKDIPLLFLLLGHQSWTKRFFQFIASNESESDINWNDCRFHTWLKEDGHLQYKDEPIVEELIILHENIHEFAQNMVIQKSKKQTPLLTDMETELKNISEHFLNMLKELSSSKLD